MPKKAKADKQRVSGDLFGHLSDGEFEEFTYDLLKALGFENVSWRRGTGKGGATADQGRDIEADLLRREFGRAHFDHYFVQCKHYTAGVSPDALDSAFTWAMAERPAVLLIIVSNALSNAAKTWIEGYGRNNRPPFRIDVWERKDLESFLSSNPDLKKKYKIGTSDPAEGLHPAHIQYLRKPSFTTMDQFIEILDAMDPAMRDYMFSFSYMSVIRPRSREPVHSKETVGELLIDPTDYAAFRKKCTDLAQITSGSFLVQGIMFETLKWMANFADPEQTKVVIGNHQWMINHLTEEIALAKNPAEREGLERMLHWMEKSLEDVPAREQKALQNYQFLCETVIPQLYLAENKMAQAAAEWAAKQSLTDPPSGAGD